MQQPGPGEPGEAAGTLAAGGDAGERARLRALTALLEAVRVAVQAEVPLQLQRALLCAEQEDFRALVQALGDALQLQ